MTTGPKFEFKRASDTEGWWKRARAWWRENAAFVVGPWLIAVSVVVAVVAVVVWSDQQATKQAARVACERSMLLGPYLAEDYERRGVFPPEIEPQVRATLPKSCPK